MPTAQELDAKQEALEQQRAQQSSAGESLAATSGSGLQRIGGAQSGEEHVACPGGCGRTVLWVFLEHGIGARRTRLPAVPPTCPACTKPDRDEARAAAEAAEAQRAEAEQQRSYFARVADRTAEMLDVLKACGVSTREHGRVTLDTFDWSECGEHVREEAERFLEETRAAGPHDAVQGLYLAGPEFGAGKTQLAVAIARDLLRDPDWDPREVVVDVAAELITEVQDCYRGVGSAREVKRRRIDARLYVLDDLGTERPSEDVARVLYEILNARAFAPTVITSNLLPEQLEQRHPELARVGSRLGPAYFRGVLVRGSDRRYRERVA